LHVRSLIQQLQNTQLHSRNLFQAGAATLRVPARNSPSAPTAIAAETSSGIAGTSAIARAPVNRAKMPA